LKLIGYSYSHEQTTRITSLLKFKGIPTHITYAYGHAMSYKAAIFVCIDHQLNDAKLLLANPNHVVSDPVDIEEFDKLNVSIGHGAILKWALWGLVVVLLLFAVTVYVVWRTQTPKPNYAIKATSVERLVSSFASGASAPYFGC
jgi:cytochrome b subunit of formate dehydrogenase